MINNRADLEEMIKITQDNVNRSTLKNLLAHADAAGIGHDEARFLNYFGRTEGGHGAWARWLEHEKGTSGATRLCRLLAETRLAQYYVRSSRFLAHGDDNWETEQLEAIACQLAGVGGGHGLNQAHAGPWRYAVGRGRRDDSLFVFLATLCARGWGDRPLCEARFHRVQNYNNGDARRAHTYRRRARPRPPNTRPAQALDTSAPWRRNFSRGAAAVDRLAEGSFAADAFGSADGLLAATPREILSALSHRFGAWSPRSRRDSPASISTA